MGGWVDVDALVEQLLTDLSVSGRAVHKPKEVVELVTTAAEKVLKDERKHTFPIGPSPCTNAIAGGGPRRGIGRLT